VRKAYELAANNLHERAAGFPVYYLV